MAKTRINQPYVPLPASVSTMQSQALPTAGAVIYGNPSAASNLGSRLNYLMQSQDAREQAKQAEAQRIAQQWRDNEMEAFSGPIWSDQIAKNEEELYKVGQELMLKGDNPWESMSPESQQFRRNYRNVVGLRNYANNIGTQYIETLKNVRSNPLKYDPKSIQELNDFIYNTNLNEAYAGNAQLPMLQAKFNAAEAIKGVKAVIDFSKSTEGGYDITVSKVNKPKTQEAIIATLMNSPGGAEFVSEMTSGLPVNEVRAIPDTVEENIAFINNMYDGDPSMRLALAQEAGITSKDSPEYQQMVEEMALERLAVKQNFENELAGLVAMASSGVKEEEMRVRNTVEEDLNIRKQNLQARWAEINKSEKEPTSERFLPTKEQVFGSGNNTKRLMSRNVLELSNASMNFAGIGGYNIDANQPMGDVASVPASMVQVAEWPFDRTTGRLVDNNNLENNPNLEWRPMVHLRAKILSTGRETNILLPADRVPLTSLPNDKEEAVKYFIDQTKKQQSTNSRDPLGLGL